MNNFIIQNLLINLHDRICVLSPKSIAVIGASDKRGSVGATSHQIL